MDCREASTSLRDLLKSLHLTSFIMKYKFACSKHIMFQYPPIKGTITFNYFSLNTYKISVYYFLSFLLILRAFMYFIPSDFWCTSNNGTRLYISENNVFEKNMSSVRKVKNVCAYNPRSCVTVRDQSCGVFSRV